MNARIYQVTEFFDACNIYTVRATSCDDAIAQVLANDESAILDVETPMPFPSRRKMMVRWLRPRRDRDGG